MVSKYQWEGDVLITYVKNKLFKCAMLVAFQHQNQRRRMWESRCHYNSINRDIGKTEVGIFKAAISNQPVVARRCAVGVWRMSFIGRCDPPNSSMVCLVSYLKKTYGVPL